MLILTDATRVLFKPLLEVPDTDQRIRVEFDPKHNTYHIDAWRECIGTWGATQGKLVRTSPAILQRTFISRFIGGKPHTPTKNEVIHSDFCHHVPATDINSLLLLNLWPLACLDYADHATELRVNNVAMQARLTDVNAINLARFKSDGTLPDAAYEQEISAEKPLSPYQLLPLVNMVNAEGFGLFMEMGTGKTPTTIARLCNAVRELREAGNNRVLRVIVVCPNNARANWENELGSFATRSVRVTIFRGDDIARVKNMLDFLRPEEGLDISVAITGYGILRNSWANVFSKVPWDIAVADEGHNFKDPKSKTAETVLKLRDKSSQRITLTGTPIANSIADLYMQFEFMWKGNSGFNSFSEFKKYYCKYEMRGDGTARLAGYQNLPMLQERLARCTYEITLKEALPDLPDRVNDIYEIEMSPEQDVMYKSLAADLIVRAEALMSNAGSNREMVASCILTQLLRLSQITSGFFTWGAEFSELTGEQVAAREIEFLHPNPKLAGLCELLADKPPTSKTIIWTCWTPDIEQISHMLEYNNLDFVTYYGKTGFDERIEAERRFNEDDNCKIILANSAAGGTALNLLGYPPGEPHRSACNADHTIYYSQNWSQPIRTQSGKRNHRRGTRVQVRETDLVVPNTIDEEIRARVIQKQATAFEIKDIRNLLQTVLKRNSL